MLQFRQGSHLHQIVTLLSIVGEYPMRSLYLLGSERVIKALIHKLTMPQVIRNSQTGMEMSCRLLTITGKGANKSIRLYKSALPILEWIHPNAKQYYLQSYWNHKFPGDASHLERNHRVAEAVAMCMAGGIEVRPYVIPTLQNVKIDRVVPKGTVMYVAKDIKKIGNIEMNKTMFTRMTGAIFSYDRCFAVYNTRNAVMKWSGMGEFKTKHNLIEVARLNSDVSNVKSAILFGQSEDIALSTIQESEKQRRFEYRFDSIYQNIHFIPMTNDGVRQIKLILSENYQERVLDLLFEPETRSYNKGLFEYDAHIGSNYILSQLDSDIARLFRFKEAIENTIGDYEVICFPHQTHFIKSYIGDAAAIKAIDMDLIEKELEAGKEDTGY